MAKILFLSHRVPFPPDKGDKIRAGRFLEHLAGRHEVWFGAGADDLEDLKRLTMTKARFADTCVVPLGPARRACNMAVGLVTGAPLSVARFRHPTLDRWVDKVLRTVRPDLVLVCSSAMAQYVTGRVEPTTGLVVDFVDADAEKWRAYASVRSPLRWIFAREAQTLVQFERRVLQTTAAGVLVSETERRLLAAFAPDGAAKLHVVPNGVDTDHFQSWPVFAEGCQVVFCGRMDYRPNIDGAQWFARDILPRVRQRCPRAVFRIVGAKPTRAVLALQQLPGVEVVGAVPDVRPYLAQASVVVAPLRIARGIQNKVLEGMAAGRPVVATPQALDGIGARIGVDVLMGADEAQFAAAVCDVLLGQTGDGIGAQGRRFVLQHHQWPEQLNMLDRIMAQACPRPLMPSSC